MRQPSTPRTSHRTDVGAGYTAPGDGDLRSGNPGCDADSGCSVGEQRQLHRDRTTGVQDAANNPLAVQSVWTFTTALDTTAPTVVLTAPVNGRTGFPRIQSLR